MSRCYLCDKKSNKEKKIWLHRFPVEKEFINKQWLDVCGLNERDNVNTTKICSRHFEPDDFAGISKGRLKPSAVPSIKVINPKPKCSKDSDAVQELSTGSNNKEPKLSGNVGAKVDSVNAIASSSNGLQYVNSLMIPTPVPSAISNSAAGLVLLNGGTGMYFMPPTQLRVRNDLMGLNCPDIATPSTIRNDLMGLIYPDVATPSTIRNDLMGLNYPDVATPSTIRNDLMGLNYPDVATPSTIQNDLMGLNYPDVATPSTIRSDLMELNYPGVATPSTISLSNRSLRHEVYGETTVLNHLQNKNRRLISLLVKTRSELAKLRVEMGKRSELKAQEKYSVEAVFMDLKDLLGNGLPQGWGFCPVPGGLFLSRIGEVLGQVTRSVLIKEDMTVEIRGRGKLSDIVEVNKITCSEDILSVLKKVNTLRLCAGDSEGWCIGEGFIRPGSNARHRCEKCRISYRMASKAEYSATRRLLARKRHIMEKLQEKQALKRKLRRLESKMEKAKEEIRCLRNPAV